MAEWCLVTGGAGFIGSHLVDALTAAGKRVRVLDDFSTGLTSNLPHGAVRPDIVNGNVADLATVERAVSGCKVVYHFAAMASVAKSLEQPLLCHATCATGTLNVIDAARRAGVKRIVYAASSSCYGNATNAAGLDEDTPLQTLSPYAAAKLAGEHYLEAAATSFGLETVRCRFFNIFGPRQRADSPYSGVIAIFAAAMMAGKTPTVHGDGLQARDFTYVANAVDAVMKAGSTPGVSGQVFNVGTGKSVNLLELVAALNEVLGTNIAPTHGPARTGDVRFSLAKIDHIRAALGYEPATGFVEGLRKTVEWMQAGGK